VCLLGRPLSSQCSHPSPQLVRGLRGEATVAVAEACCTHPLHVLIVLRLMVRALTIDGRSYDICVKLCGSDRVLLLVGKFEDVKAPGLLTQAAEAEAGCPGCLEDEDEGIYWPSDCTLERKGCYIFYPSLPRHGESTFVTVLARSDETISQ
jgi:hypothetical protein